MVAVVASDDPATGVYVQSKVRQAARLGVTLQVLDLGARITQADLHRELERLSADDAVHGIVLELPLAPGLDADLASLHMAPAKDVEGLTPANLALVAAGREPERSCRPRRAASASCCARCWTCRAPASPSSGRAARWAAPSRGCSTTAARPSRSSTCTRVT